MLTSSISGEGKTFCSINIATVFALSEKKTIIVGLDLRKPKIFDDFKIKNDIGAVNYLIGQKKNRGSNSTHKHSFSRRNYIRTNSTKSLRIDSWRNNERDD